jgi:tripartite-type tricarboxylate transporter receptor subunit TctC
MVLVVNAKSSYQSLTNFIEAARDSRNQLSVGGTGPNTTQHLAFEALKQATNADFSFVSFSGDPPAVSNVLGGHITAVLANYAGVKDHLGAALRPLAVGSHERLAELPDVPTFSEAGFSEVDAMAWIGLVLPCKDARGHDQTDRGSFSFRA